MATQQERDAKQATYWRHRARRECVRCGRPTGHGGPCCLPCQTWKRDYQRAACGYGRLTAAEKSAIGRRAALRRWYPETVSDP